jgi:tetratricopeptide (TPR) repeat protein
MGPVWWRYLECTLNPSALSIIHDVPVRTSWSAVAIAGWLMIVVTGALAARTWWRRDEPAWLAAWLTFFVPLAPVSQVFLPLQNRMADRYLWLSVLALAWLLALLVRKLASVGVIVGLFLLLVFGASTMRRANLFGDSVALFEDATRKTKQSAMAPYLLGYALEQRKNEPAARTAYAEVLRRSGTDDPVRAATNNLARLEVSRGALAEAESILRKGIQKFPEDGKMRDNLIKVLFREGKVEEARRLFGLPPSAPKAAPAKPPAPATSSETPRRKRRSKTPKPIKLF